MGRFQAQAECVSAVGTGRQTPILPIRARQGHATGKRPVSAANGRPRPAVRYKARSLCRQGEHVSHDQPSDRLALHGFRSGMEHQVVTQASVRCGHIDDVDIKRCDAARVLSLGRDPLELVTAICCRCRRDDKQRSIFRDLGDRPSLYRYWSCRKANGARHIYGPLHLGAGARVPPRLSLDGEAEARARELWLREATEFVERASKSASAVFIEGEEAWCLVSELGREKGRALMERAIEKTLDDIKDG